MKICRTKHLLETLTRGISHGEDTLSYYLNKLKSTSTNYSLHKTISHTIHLASFTPEQSPLTRSHSIEFQVRVGTQATVSGAPRAAVTPSGLGTIWPKHGKMAVVKCSTGVLLVEDQSSDFTNAITILCCASGVVFEVWNSATCKIC